MTSERNDSLYVENAGISFAIYCDENGLSTEDGEELAERIYDWLLATAQDRVSA